MCPGILKGVSDNPELAVDGVEGVILSDAWNQQAVVRVAKRLAGWPRCSPSEFLGSVGEALDKLEEYQDKGLSLPDLSDMAARVRLAEEEAQPTYIEDEARYALTKEARAAVRKLFAYDFPSEVTARILGIEETQVQSVQNKLSLKDKDIVRLHLAGHHPKVIAARLNLGWRTVTSRLEQLGHEPNYKHKLATKELGDAIRADRAAGKTLGQIAKERDVSLDKVKNAVYGGRGKHRKVTP